MITTLRIARYAAVIITLATSAVFKVAQANHYILPCPPDCRDSGSVQIGAEFTGTWFGPSQNGHGFVIEVLPGQPPQMLVSWFVFGPQGGQSWIVGRGPIDRTRAVLQGNQMTGGGGRFPPNFDPAGIRAEAWGTLSFTFNDCDHGHVEWVSSVPGYGSGGMDLERLTLPAGLVCQTDDSGRAQDSDNVPN